MNGVNGANGHHASAPSTGIKVSLRSDIKTEYRMHGERRMGVGNVVLVATMSCPER